jgi:hypothetical protein
VQALAGGDQRVGAVEGCIFDRSFGPVDVRCIAALGALAELQHGRRKVDGVDAVDVRGEAAG